MTKATNVKEATPVPPSAPPPKPPVKIEREAIDNVFGGEEGLDAALKAYSMALTAHAKTVGLPAPTTHPWVELITRQHGGLYEVVEPPPVASAAKVEEIEPATDPEPEPEPTLEEVKATVKRQISDLRLKKVRDGVRYKGFEFYGDAMATNSVMSVVVALADEPNAVLRWKAKNGEYAELEKIDFTILLKLLRKHTQACFDAEYALRQRIDSAGSLRDLKKIDYNVGWPE